MLPTTDQPPACYPEGRLAAALTDRLRALSYPAFSSCLADVLAGLGYSDVALSDRSRDRGPHGSPGIDFTATLPTPLGGLRVGGQFKRYRGYRVSRQHVSVLAAAIRRRGLAQGLIVAAGEFSEEAREEAGSEPGRPVRLLDGQGLARAMAEAGIGCVRVTDWLSGEPRYLLDEPYFAGLERRSQPARGPIS